MNIGVRPRPVHLTRRAVVAGVSSSLFAAGAGWDARSESAVSTAGAGSAAVRPQDDFYTAVNAEWLDATSIPPEVPWISHYVVNTLRVQAQVRAIANDISAGIPAPGTDAARIADLYRSYVDEATIERLGLVPLAGPFERIEALRSSANLSPLLSDLMRDEADASPDARLPDVTPFTLTVRADDRDARRNILHVAPAGLGLPGRDYYVGDGPFMVQVRAAYKAHVARMLALSGVAAPDAAADRVLALETELARSELPQEALHDPAVTYNVFASEDFSVAFPGLQWTAFFKAAGLEGVGPVVVEQPVHLRAAARLARELPIADWKFYFRWHLLRRYARMLPKAFRDEDFSFHGRVLSGNKAERTRADDAMLFTEGAMGEALGRLWVERHFDQRAKPEVTAMAEEMRTALAERIRGADWLEPQTKAAALAKLSKLLIKVAYPDEWTDYSGLHTAPHELIANARRVGAWTWRRRLARLGASNDRARWLNVPQATSAYYNRSTNELAIPAGCLQPPFYDSDADLASNLGALGAVIGHEMGHAFDDQGSRFDGDGNVRDWWTPADRARFERRAAGIVAQYGDFEPLPGARVNGRLTLSENIGDLTGLTLAHATLVRLRVGRVAEDESRRFFEAFGVRWRSKYREELLRRILSSDGHPPQQFRCNGPLQNFEPFYAAYGVTRGDRMYRPPSLRVSIW